MSHRKYAELIYNHGANSGLGFDLANIVDYIESDQIDLVVSNGEVHASRNGAGRRLLRDL